MKKIIYILLLATATITTTNVYALENTNTLNDYQLTNSGSKEDYLLNQSLSAQRLNQISNNNSIQPRTGSYISLEFLTGSSYPNYQQEKSYWCGPATIKQAVQWINGSSLSQQTYATSMGTNSTSGSYVYKMRNEMNLRQSSHSYVYTDASTLTDKWDMWGMVTSDIRENEVPVIVHGLTGILYMYNGRNLGHYFTLVSYYDDYQGSEYNYFEYMDTYYNNYGRGSVLGLHTVNFDDLYNSLHNSGRFIIW